VGGTAATSDIGLFSLLTLIFQVHWFVASIVAFVTATFVNYFLSIRFVFKSGGKHKKHHEILGVFLISGISLFFNQIILFFTIEKFHIMPLASKCIATAILFFWNYLTRKKFIFE
jgi:hypothetical protein